MQNLFDLNKDHAIIKHLNWEQLAAKWVGFAHFNFSKSYLTEIPSVKSKQDLELNYQKMEIIEELLRTSEIDAFFEKRQNISVEFDFHKQKQILQKFGLFDLEQINQWVLLWESYFRFPLNKVGVFLISKVDQIVNLTFEKNLRREFREFVTPKGEIQFEKHPKLKILYKALIDHENHTKDFLRNLSRNATWVDRLQQGNFDIMDDRYVFAFRTDRFEYSIGKIVSRSDSGHTLYVEPNEVKSFSTTRLKLKEDLEEEIYNLTRRYSEVIFNLREFFEIILDFHEKWDLLIARTIASRDQGWKKPKISTESVCDLIDSWHPLLENPVTNSIHLDYKNRICLISGPNTGGKSVALKTVALSILMLHAGFYLPSLSPTISPISALYYLSEDQQNLIMGLSSFAAQVRSVVELMNAHEDEGLVIADEIFNSTSSEEASALAFAIINYFEEKTKLFFLLSSHHQRLKVLVHQRENYISAHVGFDLITQMPTYKLHWGIPGSSFAFATFRKYLNPYPHLKHVLENAETIHDRESVEYEKLLESLQYKERELENLLFEQKSTNAKLKSELEAARLKSKKIQDENLSKFLIKIGELESDAKKLVNQIKDGESFSRRKIEEKFWELSKNAKDHAVIQNINNKDHFGEHLEDHQQKQQLQISELLIGEQYYSQKYKTKVQLLKILNKIDVEVMLGKIKSKIPFSDLQKFNHHFYQNNKNQKTIKQFEYFYERSEEVLPVTFDARGFRLEEFESKIEQYFSALITNDLPFVDVIHGHGDGVLKNWLRKHIVSRREFTFEIPNTSGDGMTKILLKN